MNSIKQKFVKDEWDIKTFNIEYYDIQYAAERTIYEGKNMYDMVRIPWFQKYAIRIFVHNLNV